MLSYAYVTCKAAKDENYILDTDYELYVGVWYLKFEYFTTLVLQLYFATRDILQFVGVNSSHVVIVLISYL